MNETDLPSGNVDQADIAACIVYPEIYVRVREIGASNELIHYNSASGAVKKLLVHGVLLYCA
jgi:hypothetical protein